MKMDPERPSEQLDGKQAKTAKTYSCVFKIFPNTGHYIEFIPINVSKGDGAGGSERESTLTKNAPLFNSDTSGWTVAASSEGSLLQWLRYRIGPRTIPGRSPEAGVWIALDSNLGDNTRGIILSPWADISDAAGIRPERVKESDDSPYAFVHTNQLPDNSTAPSPVVRIPILRPGSKEELLTVDVEIVWKRMAAARPRDVDLIVDFGNTRTMVMLLEDELEPHQTLANCRPLCFFPRGEPTSTTKSTNGAEDNLHEQYSIIDSWIVMHETLFSNLEPPRTDMNVTLRESRGVGAGLFQRSKTIVKEQQVLPHLFVEHAPVVLGGGAHPDGATTVLAGISVTDGDNSFLSSPKRYAWDGDCIGDGATSYWTLQENRWSASKKLAPTHRQSLKQLQGPILTMMDPDGRFWDLDAGAPCPFNRENIADRPHSNESPTHPRRDALTWAALAVLECAYRQINIESCLPNDPYVARKLHTVIVTFPSGWTSFEMDNYRQQWQKAINIFAAGRFSDFEKTVDKGGSRPRLVMDLDEAVASQLPIIFSEARRLPDSTWFELIGRTGKARTKAIVRVLNIDIGGGTTDISVISYQNESSKGLVGVNLAATLLLKHGSSVAGDFLVRKVIEEVLLPLLIRNQEDDTGREKLRAFFSDPLNFGSRRRTQGKEMSRFTHLLLVPLVHAWLGELCRPQEKDVYKKNVELLNLNEDEETIKGFEEFVHRSTNEPFSLGVTLKYEREKLEECVRESLKGIARTAGSLVAAFDCDLVLVSGKPSELPPVRKLFEREIPLLPQRLIFAKDFPAGEWYPFRTANGTIADAKSVTVVGAALARAMQLGKVKDWKCNRIRGDLSGPRMTWGIIDPTGELSDFHTMNPNESKVVWEMMIRQTIGCKRFRSKELPPEQIYRLRWKPEAREKRKGQNPLLELTIERCASIDNSLSETLKISAVKVSSVDNTRQMEPVRLDEIELQVCTLESNVFWKDNPSFRVRLNP